MAKQNKITALMIFSCVIVFAQSNTAVESGSIGKCFVWDYPYTIYNNSGASQTVGDGITVTVDENRNIGSVNLSGTGALDLSGANGITMSGSGTEITCRWDLESRGSHTLVNSSTPLVLGTVFTTPQAGNYMWIRKNSEWSATVSGAYLLGEITVKSVKGRQLQTFEQDQPGRCGTAPGGSGSIPPKWNNIYFGSMAAGDSIFYVANVASSTDPACNDTTLSFTAGGAYMLYDN
ncbi:hypothetical protein LUD75_10580 [Epilithonimonas sp. JDS]|uniref:hypothetical protein n=1 Tax=Epilithonimonas sp. JDS TaxID=2902797 RepID=UPI001E620B5F|nr:hypothetical protein [Epilithonimonas sp. JDS]MCD9855156.1 hypothetical protein [Epilithonimonas sp. JDS]